MTKHKKSKAKAGSVPDAEKSKPEPALSPTRLLLSRFCTSTVLLAVIVPPKWPHLMRQLPSLMPYALRLDPNLSWVDPKQAALVRPSGHRYVKCRFPRFNICSRLYSKLRRVFRAIQAIKSQSGWTWSDTRGADIGPEMEQEWVKFLKIHKDAKPFKNRGWVHLEKMTEIMPVTLRGTYVYRPSQGVTGMDATATIPRSPSPDWDESLFSATRSQQRHGGSQRGT
jgi:hypothetical protein